jgi:hypothetical protein
MLAKARQALLQSKARRRASFDGRQHYGSTCRTKCAHKNPRTMDEQQGLGTRQRLERVAHKNPRTMDEQQGLGTRQRLERVRHPAGDCRVPRRRTQRFARATDKAADEKPS